MLKEINMDKVEVDPQLFIKCRLCLEELGVYQIVPTVKDQILFCFDIKVEPFDGFPQLICKKCEAILNNFNITKQTFQTKQTELKKRVLETNNILQKRPHEDNSSQLSATEEVRPNAKKRKIRLSSSSDFEQGQKCETSTDTSKNWQAGYNKKYMCRFCDTWWASKKSLYCHNYSKHTNIKKKHSNVLKRHCKVKLHKFDDKLNLTGSNKNVMHSKKKIFNTENPDYFILYRPKDHKYNKRYYPSEEDEVSSDRDCNVSVKNNGITDSSDEELLFKPRRKRRLSSGGSNDTVVIDKENFTSDVASKSQVANQNRTPAVISECINIDDSSSESESEDSRNHESAKTTSMIEKQTIVINETIINDILTVCKNKYIKKNPDNFSLKPNKSPTDIAIQLKRKILSVGTKIINKKRSMNCTALLRFIEHKNLETVFIPRSISSVSKDGKSVNSFGKDSNYIKIVARKKNVGEIVSNETGWMNFENEVKPIGNQLSELGQLLKKNISTVSTDPRPKTTQLQLNDPSKDINVSVSVEQSSAVLILEPVTNTDTRKILNANPVANPKQLPKKNHFEFKTNKVALLPTISDTGLTTEDDQDNICMPVIMSTTSLANSYLLEKDKNNTQDNSSTEITCNNNLNNDDQKKSVAPRIKVKPVSELMSKETLSRLNRSENNISVVSLGVPFSLQSDNNPVINSYVPKVSVATSQFQDSEPSQTPVTVTEQDHIMLDTVELPNTKTDSPFKYLKTLLQMHNMSLLDSDANLNSDFHNLIKFKVVYKQESRDQLVTLCISLFCSKNVFCMKIKDRYQENLNMSKISANWQWEILKVYQGDVVNKLLQNAYKVSSEVHEYTNNFVCLLKSINCKRVT